MSAWDEVLDVDYQPIFKEARNLHPARDAQGAQDRRIERSRATNRERCARDRRDLCAQMEMDHAGAAVQRSHGRSGGGRGVLHATPCSSDARRTCGRSTRRGGLERQGDVGPSAKVFDPTCGSGTLLTAYLTAAKAKARKDGAPTREGAGAAQTRRGANADGARREPGLTTARRSPDDPRRPSRAIRQDELGETRIRIPGSMRNGRQQGAWSSSQTVES